MSKSIIESNQLYPHSQIISSRKANLQSKFSLQQSLPIDPVPLHQKVLSFGPEDHQQQQQSSEIHHNSLKPKLFRISSHKSAFTSKPGGYIPKLPIQGAQKKIQTQKSSSNLDNFVLENVPIKTSNSYFRPQLASSNINTQESENTMKQNEVVQYYYQQQSQIVSTPEVKKKEEKSPVKEEEDEEKDQFDNELLDAHIVEKIEKYKKEKEQKQQKINKMKKDYQKSDIVNRVQNYGQKAIYEELKLREIEIRNSLKQMNTKSKSPEDQDKSEEKRNDIIMRNIMQQNAEKSNNNEIGFVPHCIPFSNQALFTNLSEKERFIKFSNEFNKVKAQIDQHRHEDYDITYLYLKSKIGQKIEPTREQVKNFMKFIKDENRIFDLRRTLDEIINEVVAGKYSHSDRFDELSKLKQRVSTANIANTINSNQHQLQTVIDQYKADLGQNYIIWNQKNEFNYDALPRRMPTNGPRRRQNKRKNLLQYQRKVPHAVQAQRMSSIMTDYIENNKQLGAKEVIPPSLENEFSCAVNFNKETVNTVLNFAQESKVRLLNSLSTNNLLPNSAQKDLRSAKTPYTQSTKDLQLIGKDNNYQKISKLHNVESESVYKRNRLMLEHVMLERAVHRLNSRKEKRDASKLNMKDGTNDWKIRQAVSNEIFEKQRVMKSAKAL